MNIRKIILVVLSCIVLAAASLGCDVHVVPVYNSGGSGPVGTGHIDPDAPLLVNSVGLCSSGVLINSGVGPLDFGLPCSPVSVVITRGSDSANCPYPLDYHWTLTSGETVNLPCDEPIGAANISPSILSTTSGVTTLTMTAAPGIFDTYYGTPWVEYYDPTGDDLGGESASWVSSDGSMMTIDTTPINGSSIPVTGFYVLQASNYNSSYALTPSIAGPLKVFAPPRGHEPRPGPCRGEHCERPL